MLALRFWYVPVIAALVLALAAVGGHASRLSHDLTTRTGERDAARNLVTVSETARKRETDAARVSYEGLQTTCTAGLALAVTRGRTIERVTANPGSRRVGATADQLRDIVGQAPDADRRP
jgi:hypothetical protein